jgi:hypothetical protein
MLKHRSVCLFGPEAAALPFAAPWAAVLEAMRHNLDVYWPGIAARREGLDFIADYWVEFAVSTLCRILTTLEVSKVVSKAEALERWHRRLPPRWWPLIDEARRLRHAPAAPSCYGSPTQRMEDARAFVAYVRDRADVDAAIARSMN